MDAGCDRCLSGEQAGWLGMPLGVQRRYIG
jgi:hypothetical protein